MKNTYKILILLLFPLFGYSQIAHQTNAWYMYFGNHKLNEKWALHTEYQFRRSGLIKDWQQSLARVGLDYKLKDKSMITAGYAWVVSYPYGEQPISAKFTEHRIFQQYIMNSNSGRFYFNHRYRLEQRFLQNVIVDNSGQVNYDGYRFLQRARYRFMISIPLNKPKMEDKTIFLAFYDEVFIGFGEGIGSNILDQNRLFAALGYRFNKDVNVQLGYLNHRIYKGDGISREYNHTLQAGLTYNLDFSKKID